MNKLAHKLPHKITPKLNDISEKLEKVLLPYEKKQEGDRAKDTIRAALQCFVTITPIADEDNHGLFADTFSKVKNN